MSPAIAVPADEQDRPVRTPVSVLASMPFALCSALCGPCDPGDPEVGGRLPELAAAFWPDGLRHGDEALVVAHRLGVLGATSFDELAAAIRDRPLGRPHLRLAGEDGADRTRIVARVDELRRSARRRRGYVELLRAAWDEVRPTWERAAAGRLPRAVRRYRALLDQGVSWRTFSPTPRREQFVDALLAEIGHNHPVVLLPTPVMAAMFVLDLGDTVAVGLPLPEPTAADADELASLLKALAHPTRLAIMGELRSGAAPVGQLARRFGLAQPTVTNHLKLLRQAGLVRPAADPRAGVEVDRPTLRSVGDRLAELAGADVAGADVAGAPGPGAPVEAEEALRIPPAK